MPLHAIDTYICTCVCTNGHLNPIAIVRLFQNKINMRTFSYIHTYIHKYICKRWQTLTHSLQKWVQLTYMYTQANIHTLCPYVVKIKSPAGRQ